MRPRISVVVPTLNQEEFIEATIRSVLLQQYPNLQLIVVDGASIDKTPEIIRHYEAWIDCWLSERDEGQTDAIIKGMKKADGELVNWLNSDDILMPGGLDAIAGAWTEAGRPESAVICGHARYIDQSGRFLVESKVRHTDNPVLPMAPPVNGGIQASFFLTAAAWKAVGGIDRSLNYTMDTDLWFRCNIAKAQFLIADHEVAAYREHGDSKTAGGWRESIAYKKRFYLRWLGTLESKDKKLYATRVKKLMYGFYLRAIGPSDGLLSRIFKGIGAVRWYPASLFQGYRMKRILRIVFVGRVHCRD